MSDLTKYADTMFYAGKPDEAGPTRLAWNGFDYSMSVVALGDRIEASMAAGNCVWSTPIGPASFVEDVDAALQDACQLVSAYRGYFVRWAIHLNCR